MYQLTNKVKIMVKKVNGRRKQRTLSTSDVDMFYAKLNEVWEDKNIHTIRVYSSDGFVANSYSYRADISVIEAQRDLETGQFEISVFTVDAKRSRGQGALITINGRAAE
jgi:hypothetical protein